MKKVRIESDGTPFNTKVFLGDDEITHSIEAVTWTISKGNVAHVQLTFYAGDVIVDGMAKIEDPAA